MEPSTSISVPAGGGAAGPPALRAFRRLDHALRTGTYPPGSRLPPERELAGRLGISRTTLRQALGALAESGRVRASPNRGWYVAGPPISEGPNGFTSFTRAGLERHLAAGARILVQRVRSATLDEADALGLAPTAPIVELERLRTLDGVPICVSHDRMPMALVAPLTEQDLADRSLAAELERACGIVPTRCAYEVEAIACDGRRAELLGVTSGVPLLVTREMLFDQHDRPVSLGLTAYRGDAFRFRATLFKL